MAELTVVRLLQNPLGQPAPEGERGDLIRVSDGQAKVYLMPWEFDAVDEQGSRFWEATSPRPGAWVTNPIHLPAGAWLRRAAARRRADRSGTGHSARRHRLELGPALPQHAPS